MDFLKRLLNQQPDEQTEPTPTPTPAPEESAPEVEEFMDVGGSPVPGITLRAVLKGHQGVIGRVAWSSNGELLGSISAQDHSLRVWDVQKVKQILQCESSSVHFSWSPENRLLAYPSKGNIVIVDVRSSLMVQVLHGGGQYGLCWTPDGKKLLAKDGGDIQIWDVKNGQVVKIKGSQGSELFLSPDGRILADPGVESIHLLDLKTGEKIRVLEGLGHAELAWSFNGKLLAVKQDHSIIMLDGKTYDRLYEMQGHTGNVLDISFSADGQLLASKGEYTDNTVRIWDCRTGRPVCMLSEISERPWPPEISFHPLLPRLATLAAKDTTIRIWDIDTDVLLRNAPATKSVHYTTAKVVLVGDSGVGKTGLGWRMAHGQFKEHASTHGQQFWVVDQLGKTRDDGTQCEAVVWDLAGQHVYRQVHAIFLDDVDASLVLFDPTNRQEPLKGAQFWLEQLKGTKELPPTILVGARLDRGQPVLAREELEQFCRRYGVSGGYVGTSAMSGEGVAELMEALKAQIPWDRMTTTVTTETFKRIKDFVLALKARTDRRGVLVHPAALRAQLQASDRAWQFSDAEMLTAVGHLQTHGYVTLLRGSDGAQQILLTPELLVSLASSIVLQADRHVRELGAVSESELLQGNYPLEELRGLDAAEQQILIDAAVQRFLFHNICFRETLASDTLLIFPGLIKQKRPLADDQPTSDDISYVVRGRVENLYAMLVVLLGYTPSFTRINQWQSQAQYELGAGEICGFRMVEEREGELELVVYYGERLPQRGREQFLELFELFLYQREVEVTRFPPVICPRGHRQKRATVVERMREGKSFAFCDECGSEVALPDSGRPEFGLDDPLLRREEAVARLQSLYETHLVQVKSYRRAWAAPRCLLSAVPGDAELRRRLVRDLQNAGVHVLERAADVGPEDYVVMLFSDAYRAAWSSPTLADEGIRLAKARLAGDKRRLLRMRLQRDGSEHAFADCKPFDIADETHYPVGLFDLVLTLYAIPLDHAAFKPLRQALHGQWERMPRERPAVVDAAQPQPSAPAAPEATAGEPEAERYLDFELQIALDGHATASSDEGEEAVNLDVAPPASIELALTLIEQGVVNAKLYRDVGKALYDWLLPGPLHTLFERTETRARLEGAKLRLRLRVEPPTIARLPLELLYRASGGYFLAINPGTVVSRYLRLPLPPGRARRRAGPLHLLAVIAAPSGLPAIDVDAWEQTIRQSLAQPIAAGALTLDVVREATRRNIRDALLRRSPDLLQIVGHGIYADGQGRIALVDEAGGPWKLDEEQFANLLLGHEQHLGLIGLASCASGSSDDPQRFSGLAPRLVQRCGVPAVVAMQFEVQIPAAQLFFEEFYSALAARKPVDWAAQAGRKAISQHHGLDNRAFAAPVLYMRAADGALF